MELIRVKSTKYLIVLLILALTFITVTPSFVKSQDLSQIKVQLLTGQSDYESAITLKSAGGLAISTNDSTPFIYQTNANENISFQFDCYHLLLLETLNISEAMKIIEKVKEIEDTNIEPRIEVIKRNNSDYYRVIIGSFANLTKVNEVKQLLATEASINSKLLGDSHWSYGSFATLNDANSKLNEINTKVKGAFIVQVYNNDVWEYQIWIGESSNQSEHRALKSSVEQLFPGTTLLETSNLPYVIQKTNATIKNGRITKNKLFLFPKRTIVNVASISENTYIQISDRIHDNKVLKYRGTLSIQVYNDKITLVNQLPLEKYLYAVVGSEMYNSWPQEALKAQAIAARTFAYQKILNPRNSIANLYDTVSDQAYFGVNEETTPIKNAVDSTKGLVITKNNLPITAFYSANAGGMTSHGTEVWGKDISYTSVKASSFDKDALINAMDWYRIVRSNGGVGYVRSDFINFSSKEHFLGLKYGYLNDMDVNMRTAPSIYRSSIITTLPIGEEVVILEIVKENNAYSWITEPLSVEAITKNINEYQQQNAGTSSFKNLAPVMDLKVIKRGPSDRVTLLADGANVIPVKTPDNYRGLLGGLSVGIQSSKFEIEQTGKIEILGAGGSKKTAVNMQNQIYVQSASSKTILAQANTNQNEYFVLGTNNSIRVATKDQNYVFSGNGLGHGIGMSQWGAKAMAESGYTYQEILKYYYNNIEIKKIY